MRLAYRADIEGLRAIAILLVVGAHAGAPGLDGGFIGVDVFFVLSGYLITGLLVREYETTGRINLAWFYARRLQRLLPALLLTVGATMAAAMILLAPLEQVQQAPAAAAAATWTSNLYFSLSKLDYFAPASENNLFLHTWSLGVEEQFYLLWPTWILFLLGAWRWQRRQPDPSRLHRGLTGTIAACFIFCILLTYSAPQLGFYLVLSRGWQFALGGLVFLQFQSACSTASWKPYAGSLGITVIIAASILIDGGTPYPGFWALLPAVGTASVLMAGTGPGKGGTVTSLLSIRPLQAIGRISYSWYLWHWPVLLLGWNFWTPGNAWHAIALVALSLLLAIVSHGLVEAPIRRSGWLRKRPRLVLLASAGLTLGVFATAQGWSSLARQWSTSLEQQKLARIRADLPRIYAMGCDEWYHSSRVHKCVFGGQDASKTVVLMGDSIAGQWFPAVANVFAHSDWRLIVLTKSSCPMVDHPVFYPRIGREYVECAAWRDAAIGYLKSVRPTLVLISSLLTYEYTLAEWEAGTGRVLTDIALTTDRIGVLAPPPTLPFDGPACLARQEWRESTERTADECSAPLEEPGPVAAAIERAVAANPDAVIVDLGDAICPGDTCAAQRRGVVIYRDRQHLTASFVASLSGQLRRELIRTRLADLAGSGTK